MKPLDFLRLMARLVAILDFVLNVVSIVVPILSSSLTIFGTGPNGDHLYAFKKLGFWIVLFYFLIGIFHFIGMNIWLFKFIAIWKLMRATKTGKEHVEAAKLARFWRTCAITYTVVVVLLCITLSVYFEVRIHFKMIDQVQEPRLRLTLWTCIVLQCLGICVVRKFISELEAVVVATDTDIIPSQQGQVVDCSQSPDIIQDPFAPASNETILQKNQEDNPPSYGDQKDNPPSYEEALGKDSRTGTFPDPRTFHHTTNSRKNRIF